MKNKQGKKFDFHYYILTGLLGILFIPCVGIYSEWSGDQKLRTITKLELQKVEFIKVDKLEKERRRDSFQTRVELLGNTIIEKDATINNLRSNIERIKTEILEAEKNGESISDKIAELDAKENEFTHYLETTATTVKLIKDTFNILAERSRALHLEIDQKDILLDSLKKHYQYLLKNCN